MTVKTRECVFDLVNITDTSAYSFLVISVCILKTVSKLPKPHKSKNFEGLI